MPTLHIFNPDHDEALAAGTPFYTPTRAAHAMAQKGARWPHLWSEAGDYVLLPNTEAQEFPISIAQNIYPRDLTPYAPACALKEFPSGCCPTRSGLKQSGN